MITLLFWLAIPLGFIGLPAGYFSILLLPVALLSLFNEFAAPREIIWQVLAINLVPLLTPIPAFIGGLLIANDPQKPNPRDPVLLGSLVLSAGLFVYVMATRDLIGTPQGTWLITSYWFICLIQLWSAFFYLINSCLIRLTSR